MSSHGIGVSARHAIFPQATWCKYNALPGVKFYNFKNLRNTQIFKMKHKIYEFSLF